jgi:hypothetical protein
MTVLAFPRNSMSFNVHCQMVVYLCRFWLHGIHDVWVGVVGFHDQPINAHIAEAHAFFMDYSPGERVITRHAGSERIGGC